MAVAVITTTVKQTWVDGKMFNVIGTLVVSAGPDTYATGGLTLALKDPLIKAQRVPQRVIIRGINGYDYTYVAGTDNTNGKLKVNTASATELAVAAVPAAVSGDTITFRAEFLGMN